MMVQASSVVQVEEAGFAILAVGVTEVPIEAANYDSRLVGVSSIGAMVVTGTHFGEVHVALELRETPLDAHVPTPEWEEVSEVTVYTNTGNLEIGPYLDDMTTTRRDLPMIGDGRTEAYRVRVHVRGHEESFEEDKQEERFSFVIWPATGDESDVILQSSDPVAVVPGIVPGGPRVVTAPTSGIHLVEMRSADGESFEVEEDLDADEAQTRDIMLRVAKAEAEARAAGVD